MRGTLGSHGDDVMRMTGTHFATVVDVSLDFPLGGRREGEESLADGRGLSLGTGFAVVLPTINNTISL